MSYQVLARKYRPQLFKEMVGQEHVLKALINALDQNRLHHAYLFTGTRGVGKTTIARILAKCLNCEQGVSSEPCGQCAACLEIAEGRFVDLIEVDAASRTKVEDTRELLDNVQYAPTKGRFKVYLIDEVHMLSGHSFNALLKTLEEPPPHVKFLLATTDPQKLPVTVLSRCLQFNLKNMSPERIVEHLQTILAQENIPNETSALWALGRSADGSMRDALSLTDQAISFGQGKITEVDVNSMLGTIDRTYIVDLVRALCNDDGTALLQRVAAMAEHSPDYEQALSELINFIHRIAVAQVVPESIDNTFGDRDVVLELAKNLSGEDVQLFYQSALLGRRDLPLAPDPRSGFEMVLLRLLAFKPPGPQQVLQKPPSETKSSDSNSNESNQSNASPESKISPKHSSPPLQEQTTTKKSAIDTAPKPNQLTSEGEALLQSQPPTSGPDREQEVDTQVKVASDSIKTETTTRVNQTQSSKATAAQTELVSQDINQFESRQWNTLVNQLSVGGVIGNTLSHCQLQRFDKDALYLLMNQRYATLYDPSHQQRIADAISEFFSRALKVEIELGDVSGETPAAMAERIKAERLDLAVQTLKSDPLVRDVIHTFSATLREDSVVPIDH